MIPCDLSDNVKELHIFLYEDSAYTASDTVKQNSEKIVSDTGLNPATDIKRRAAFRTLRNAAHIYFNPVDIGKNNVHRNCI